MCLKLIKLAGFKSFVDPTVIKINRQVNAIVGPNGCGKSNIVDAIRWVIGEISAKKLRGQAMSDVIFSGTSGRKPVGKASVELIFDNSEGRFGGEYASFGEFSIRREVTRDGSSDYYINNTHCRRRDVLDLFMGTGLGSRSYSVIEQGMISHLIEAKPEDLRAHIGEVAGISKYKERRRETETRIAHTRDNLDRLNDLRDEIDKQLRHLQRQANAAKKFKEYQKERVELSSQVKAMYWRDIDRKLEIQNKRITTAKIDREAVYEELHFLEAATESLRTQQTDLNDELQKKQKAFYSLSTEVSQLEQQIRSAESSFSLASDELMDNENAQEEYEELVASYQTKIVSLESELQELLPQQSQVEEEKESASFRLIQAQDAVTVWRQSSDQLQTELMQLRSQQEVCQTKIQHFRDQKIAQIKRHDSLSLQLCSLPIRDAQESIVPLEDSVYEASKLRDQKSVAQQLMRERQQSLRSELGILRAQQKEIQKQLSEKERDLATQQARQEAALTRDDVSLNVFMDRNNLAKEPRLAETLKVEPKWQRAAEIVLESQLKAICVDQLLDYSEAIESLRSGELMLIDRAALTENIEPRLSYPSLLQQVDSKWSLATWLHGVYLANSISEALSMRSLLRMGESVITQDGHWIGSDWWKINIPQEETHSILGREKIMASLQSEVQTLMERIDTQEQRIVITETELRQSEALFDEVQQALLSANQKLSEAQLALKQKNSELGVLSRQKEQAEKELAELVLTQQRIEDELLKNQSQLEAAIEKLPELESENKKQLEQRDELNQVLASAQQLAARSDQKASELTIQVSACKNQLQLLHDSYNRDEKRLVSLKERKRSLAETRDILSLDIPDMRLSLNDKLIQKQKSEQSLREFEEKRHSQNWQSTEQENKRKELQKSLDEMQQLLTQLQMEREGLGVRQATVVEQLEEAGVNLQYILQGLPDEINLEDQEAKLEKLSNSIASLGAINLAAIEEFDETKERQEYLNKQHNDLTEALSMLESAIEKIDRESRHQFKETFEQINANFQRIFPEVFGGGSALLELTESDWLSAGVVVRAQPPGKRNTTIHLLSGGEKALTALALVFSMFKLNPAPFCILDEVDAPLDDLNVGRFSDLVRRMAKDTQFIMISHNKLAIAMSDQLLGITMQEPGVSRLVSVDMAEALEMVEA
jgi:chromosome segregation protein